ncbi:MAG: carboxymuconolactone decarboxylase family protein [Promethearchaeota archaeon]|jgi:alkylhydroperoxidase family enzyme
MVGNYTHLAMFLNSLGIQVALKHQGYEELSERMNADPRSKVLYEVLKEVGEIYKNEIIGKENFDKAKELFGELVKKEFFKEASEILQNTYAATYETKINSDLGKREKILVNLQMPRIKPQEFDDWSEERKDKFLSTMVQFYELSDPSEFFQIDVSGLNSWKLSMLAYIHGNIFKTICRYPDKNLQLNPYYGLNPFEPSIPARERELFIIRTGWLCQSEYECINHIRIGLTIGLTVGEVINIFKGPKASEWGAFESKILHATDELHNDYFISNTSWDILSEHYDEHQKLEFILTVGFYTKLAMFLNSVGVQVNYDYEGFGELSEKLKNFDKITEEANILITKIYRDDILKGRFERAGIKLNELVRKYESNT